MGRAAHDEGPVQHGGGTIRDGPTGTIREFMRPIPVEGGLVSPLL